MARFFLLMALVVTAMFTGIVSLIRAQPYDDSDLRTFLTPLGDCPMPCWQGIRPDMTNIDDALRILESHAWVDEITYPEIPYNKRTYWTWSAMRPNFINYFTRGHGSPGRDDTWWSIEISTIIPLGDFVLSLGQPDSLIILAIKSNSIAGGSAQVEKIMPVVVYRDLGLMIYNFVDCPARMDDLWNSWGTIVYGDVEMTYAGQVYRFDHYTLPRWLFVNAPDAGCKG
jgi:hypothetical protein